MPNEAVTNAIKSVLGDDAIPEKIRALDEALRPIYGREAADVAAEHRPSGPTMSELVGRTTALLISYRICIRFGVSSDA